MSSWSQMLERAVVPYSSFKLTLSHGYGIPDELSHFVAGLAIYLIGGWIWRRSGSVMPLVCVYAAAFVNELADLVIAVPTYPLWEAQRDIAITVVLPTLLFLRTKRRLLQPA